MNKRKNDENKMDIREMDNNKKSLFYYNDIY